MLIRERMEHTQFSPSEQIIVDYLLKNMTLLDTLSTTKIAKETYASKSTIVNVAKKLNFHGWSQLKKALHKEAQYYLTTSDGIDANFPFSASDNALEIAQKIAQLKKQSIEETANLNDFSALNSATQLLTGASHIHLFALANNLLISQEFIYNLRRINKKCDIHSLLGEGKMAAAMAQKGEVAIIISYSGETRSLVELAYILKNNQIPIILITNIGESSLSAIADVVLRISTKEKLYSKISTFSTDASITYLLDVLYSLIFSKEYEYHLNLRKNTSKIMEQSRSTQSNILRESD